MKFALESGSNFWNAGIFYGPPTLNSLHIMQAYFKQGSAEGIRKQVNLCHSMLKDVGKKIDIYQCARVDPNVPVEDSIATLGELVKEGKIGGIGLSEVNGNTIRRVAKVHPIASMEIEFGLWASDMLDKHGVEKACSELGIPIVAYSPVGRGILVSISHSSVPRHSELIKVCRRDNPSI